MAAVILDGKAIAAEIRHEVTQQAKTLARAGTPPRLVAVQVGQNPASELYTDMQAANCRAVGIEYTLHKVWGGASQAELAIQLETLNADPTVTGIILQMPLPEHLKPQRAMAAIAPEKDVEGVSPENLGKLLGSGGAVAPCTPLAAMELLRRGCGDLTGKELVIVGHSEIFGKPLAAMLLQSRTSAPTVTVCHVATRELRAHTRRAEVLVVAAGKAGRAWEQYQRRKLGGEDVALPDLSPLIGADDVSDGAVVIDVGINRIPAEWMPDGQPKRAPDGSVPLKTVGDVDFQAVQPIASAITPVPGGVGPVTVAMLLRNTLACATATAQL